MYDTGYYQLSKKIANDSLHNAALLTSTERMSYFNALNVKNGVFLQRLNERICTISLTIYFRKNSYLIEPVNDEISMYISSGLILHWKDETYLDKSWKMIVSNERVLKWKDVEGIFQIYGILLTIATIVFIGELIFDRINKIIFNYIK